MKKTRSKSRAEKRKSSQRFRIISLGILAVLTLIILIFHQSLSALASEHMVEVSRGFRISEITISGNSRVTPDSILSRSRLKTGLSLFDVDPRVVSARIGALPWVKNCYVQREFPDKITILVTERQPVASLRLQSMYVVTADSMLVLPTGENWIWDLPILTPPHSVKAAEGTRLTDPDLLKLLGQALCAQRVSTELWQNISEVYFRGGEIYTTLSRPSVELRLGEGAGELAWSGLGVYLSQSGGIVTGQSIDLSIPGKLIVTTESPTETEQVNG